MDKHLQSTNNRNLLPYIWGVARQHFKMIAALVLLGAVIATAVVYIRGTVYTSEASFLADPKIVLNQVERLDSRDMIVKAIRRLNFVQTEYYQKKGIRGEYNLYDQTPFVVHISNFPEHLLGKEMKIEFEKDGNFHYSFDSEGHSLQKEGRPGVALDLGSISFVLELTRYWSEKWADKTLYFRVHSESELAGEFRRKLKVEHLLIRKSRIKVIFKDANRRRALDMMEAMTAVMLEDWDSTNNKYIDGRLNRIQRELDYLFQEMSGSETLAKILTKDNSNFSDLHLDSLAAIGKWQEEQIAFLQARKTHLQAFEKAGYAANNFKDHFSNMLSSARDSSLLDLMALREALVPNLGEKETDASYKTVSLQIAALVNEIQGADSILMVSLGSVKNETEFTLVSNAKIRKKYLLNLVKNSSDTDISALQWTTYLALLTDRNDVTSDLMREQRTFSILDSPHLVKVEHRVRQARDIISGMLLGGILGILYVLGMAFLANRISSVEQLKMMTRLPLIAELNAGAGSMDQVVRKLRVTIELQREADDQVIAVGSAVDNHLQGMLAESLANKYVESGLRMQQLVAARPNGEEIPPEALASRLMSPEIAQETELALAENDLVLLDLPDVENYPEAWLKIRAAKQLIYLVYANESRFEHLKALESKADDENLQVLLVFVS